VISGSAAHCIPAALRAQLDALRPMLELQGVVQLHRTLDRQAAYRLRYRQAGPAGAVLHRSLPLGRDVTVAGAVHNLISVWRAERQAKETECELQADRVKLDAKKTELACRIAQCVAGGGRRRRRQIREWVNTTMESPTDMMSFSLTGALPEPRTTGRPRKARLW